MRAALLVLDGLGVGAMADTLRNRPQDAHANTLLHLAEAVGGLRLPTFQRLGLGNVLQVPGLRSVAEPLASYGEAELAYPGADSYLGHQELMGTIPGAPARSLMSEAGPAVARALETAGFRVRRPFSHLSPLLVEEAVLVADNIEADRGQIINLTVPTRLIPFERALEIGRVVRGAVRTSRVIVFGGPQITLQDVYRHLEERPAGQVGVNSPRLGVYDAGLVVRHLGYGVDPRRQLANRFASAGLPVALYGKMADLVDCPAAERDPLVSTADILARVTKWLASEERGLVAATVQETDLAGHENDPRRYADLLALVDDMLPALLSHIGPADVLAISADHGNDPTLGSHQHTRERVPVLWYRPGMPARALGRRCTLADVAASIGALSGWQWDGDGTPFE